jgi:hypothetical protein
VSGGFEILRYYHLLLAVPGRAAPSACVGKRFSAPQIVWNRSTRCAGERGGARVGRPRWLRILTIFMTTSHLVRCDRTTTRS